MSYYIIDTQRIPETSIIPSRSFKIALLIVCGILLVTLILFTKVGSRFSIIARASAENTP